MDFEKTLVEQITNILIEQGCTINKPAVLSLAIFMLEREKSLIKHMQDKTLKELERLSREVVSPTFTGVPEGGDK